MAAELRRPMRGGPLCVDLLNTAWRSESQKVDWLEIDGAVEQFTSEWGQTLSVASVDAARTNLIDARQLLRRLFESGSAEGHIDQVNAALKSARPVLKGRDGGGLALVVTGDEPQTVVATEALVDAVQLMLDRPGRIRRCAHEACILWFLDVSKGGRRRWCSMETCGNRAKAQRHYERATQVDPTAC